MLTDKAFAIVPKSGDDSADVYLWLLLRLWLLVLCLRKRFVAGAKVPRVPRFPFGSAIFLLLDPVSYT